MAINVL